MTIQKQRILSALQQVDPMATGCDVNDLMSQEYAAEADAIAGLVSSGRPLREALVVTFDDRFWEGCLNEQPRADDLERLMIELQ